MTWVAVRAARSLVTGFRANFDRVGGGGWFGGGPIHKRERPPGSSPNGTGTSSLGYSRDGNSMLCWNGNSNTKLSNQNSLIIQCLMFLFVLAPLSAMRRSRKPYE